MTDLWRFQRWAREQKLGNATRKLILTSLSITAEATSGSGYMSQGDLAEFAECSTRTVSEHLKALEARGLLARRRRFSKAGRRLADGFLLLAPGVTEWPDGDAITTGRGSPPEESASSEPAQSPPEVQASEQEQPIEQPIPTSKNAREPDRREQPPDGFPDELRPHARAVLPILQRIAEQHGAARVWPLRVGKLLMRYRYRAVVAAAHELDEWAVDPPRKIKDVVGTYGTFLANMRDLQGVEPLSSDGLPTANGARPAAGYATVGRTSLSRNQQLVAQRKARICPNDISPNQQIEQAAVRGASSETRDRPDGAQNGSEIPW